MKCILQGIMQNIPTFNFYCTGRGGPRPRGCRPVPASPTPSAGPATDCDIVLLLTAIIVAYCSEILIENIQIYIFNRELHYCDNELCRNV